MKRVLSTFLTISLCIGLFAVPANAALELKVLPEITIEIPDNSGTQLTITNLGELFNWNPTNVGDEFWLYYTQNATIVCNKEIYLYKISQNEQAYKYGLGREDFYVYCFVKSEDDAVYLPLVLAPPKTEPIIIGARTLVETYPAGTRFNISTLKNSFDSNSNLVITFYPISEFTETNVCPISDIAVLPQSTPTPTPSTEIHVIPVLAYDMYTDFLKKYDMINAAIEAIKSTKDQVLTVKKAANALAEHGIKLPGKIDDIGSVFGFFSNVLKIKQLVEFVLLYVSVEQMKEFMDSEINSYTSVSRETTDKIKEVMRAISHLESSIDLAVRLFSFDYFAIKGLDLIIKLGKETTIGAPFIGGVAAVKYSAILFGMPSRQSIYAAIAEYTVISSYIKNHSYLQ